MFLNRVLTKCLQSVTDSLDNLLHVNLDLVDKFKRFGEIDFLLTDTSVHGFSGGTFPFSALMNHGQIIDGLENL